tara:strand:- start:635 stop:1189 length:555 start_codon:yes stop_codon:yes gene_type:complete
MEVNNELLEQWEPKIHKMLQNTFILGMDRDDIAQELRIATLKAANHFDETKGVSFHTYLHTVMTNTIRTFISKAQKTKNVSTTYSINGLKPDEYAEEYTPKAVAKALTDTEASEFTTGLELTDILDRASLSPKEKDFLELRVDGLTMEQISGIVGESAYKLRASLQKKLYQSLKGGTSNAETFS